MSVYTKLFAAFFVALCGALCIVFFLIKDEKKRNTAGRAMLLMASAAFFLYAGLEFAWFFVYVILVTYVGGRVIARHRGLVWPMLAVLVLPFFVFKIMSYIQAGLIQPLGISFITLQCITYLVAVYKGEMEAERDFLQVALFAVFFPCASSGPIMEAKELMPQFKRRVTFDYDRIVDGIRLHAWGIFKKLVLADNLAIYIQNVRANAQDAEYSGTALLLAALLYSFQLYLDFSGYSDIVVGSAKVLGYDLTVNFDHPYLSRTVTEFWNRWHISLSSWLKKYIYFPLGGSRVSRPRIYLNVMIVFLVSGFWHGSGMTFIVWGILHGIAVCFERFLKGRFPGFKGSVVLTYLYVTFAWIFFSAESVSRAAKDIMSFAFIPKEIAALISGTAGSALDLLMIDNPGSFVIGLAGLIIFCIISSFTKKRAGLTRIAGMKPVLRWVCYYALILAVLFFAASEHANFIYNQF